MGTRVIAKAQPKPPALGPCIPGHAHHMVGDEPNGGMTVRAACKHCQQETWWYSSHRLDREGTFAAETFGGEYRARAQRGAAAAREARTKR